MRLVSYTSKLLALKFGINLLLIGSGPPCLGRAEMDMMVLAASQSSQARDESLLGKLPFQELFAKSTVQFFSFKVTLC